MTLILIATVNACTSYSYRPYQDYAEQCFNTEGVFIGDVIAECERESAYFDKLKIHEMSATEKRFLETPSEGY